MMVSTVNCGLLQTGISCISDVVLLYADLNVPGFEN